MVTVGRRDVSKSSTFPGRCDGIRAPTRPLGGPTEPVRARPGRTPRGAPALSQTHVTSVDGPSSVPHDRDPRVGQSTRGIMGGWREYLPTPGVPPPGGHVPLSRAGPPDGGIMGARGQGGSTPPTRPQSHIRSRATQSQWGMMGTQPERNHPGPEEVQLLSCHQMESI